MNELMRKWEAEGRAITDFRFDDQAYFDTNEIVVKLVISAPDQVKERPDDPS